MITGFPDRIKECRAAAGLTQKDLADKTGISVSAISSYETGRRDTPADALVSLSNALNCTVDYLLSGSRDETLPRRIIDISDLTDDEAQDIIYMVRRMRERRSAVSA